MKQWPNGVASADLAFGGDSKAFQAEVGNDTLPETDPADLDEIRSKLGPEEQTLFDEIAAL